MSIEDIQVALMRVTNFLRCYLPLSDAHANDFLIYDTWNRVLPSQIKLQLTDYGTGDYLEIPRNYLKVKDDLIKNKSIRTEALFKLDEIKNVVFFNEPDTFIKSDHGGGGVSNKHACPLWFHRTLSEFTQAAAACTLEVLLGVDNWKTFDEKEDFSLMSEIFVGHCMSEKKAHEIEQMSQMCANICQQINIDQVVDIGSGKGYLGTCLYLEYGLSVVEIDARPTNSEGAVRRRDNMIDRWPQLVRQAAAKRKLKSPILSDVRLPTQSTTNCDGDTVVDGQTCISLTAMVNNAQELDTIVTNHASRKKFLFTGLHTCGGLASTILRSYTQSSHCCALANVGCCYHLLEEMNYRNPFLTPDAPIPAPEFPLSDWMLQLSQENLKLGRKPFALGRNSRIIASQSLERIVDNEDDRPLHISMVYRVLVQRILFDNLGYSNDEWVVGKIGKKCPDFLSYTRACLKKLRYLDINDKLTDDAILEYEVKYSETKSRLFLFYLLRCLTAPAVETCILLDRLLFLKEQEIHQGKPSANSLVRLFDSKLSPRCYALLSIKK